MKLTTNYATGGMVAAFEYEGSPEEVAKMWRVVEYDKGQTGLFGNYTSENDKEKIIPILRDSDSGTAYVTVSCSGDYDIDKRIKKIILEEMRVADTLHR